MGKEHGCAASEHLLGYNPIIGCPSHRGNPNVYDFGAWWQHDIRLEQVLPLNPASAYPVCTGGGRACPPEGCGGPGGYRARLRERAALAALDDLALIAEAVRRFLDHGDRGTADERETLAAALARAKERDRLDPDRFDRRAVDRALQRLAHMAAD